MSVADARLLEKVARGLNEPWAAAQKGAQGSILTVAAGVYGARPAAEETTIPTGFDPQAAALFEAIVEAAYIVSAADGVLDDSEREAFAQVVSEASSGAVDEDQVKALLSDLRDHLKDDGLDTRINAITLAVSKTEHRLEILRIAGLLAHVSGGVSGLERGVLEKLAAAFHLQPREVDTALDAVKSALA
ncbi:MAG TPA: tellurite resistance TerB family protein [Polyangiaceae bacterium]|nr:tellurite resistance TerB family protein [Polyangiaceae bacterium]